MCLPFPVSLLKLFIPFVLVYVCDSVVYTVCVGAQRPRERKEPLDPGLQVVASHSVWVLGTELRSSAGEQQVL